MNKGMNMLKNTLQEAGLAYWPPTVGESYGQQGFLFCSESHFNAFGHPGYHRLLSSHSLNSTPTHAPQFLSFLWVSRMDRPRLNLISYVTVNLSESCCFICSMRIIMLPAIWIIFRLNKMTPTNCM